MKIKLILFTLLSLQVLQLKPAQDPNLVGDHASSNKHYCDVLFYLVNQNASLDAIKGAIQSCEGCKKNAFTDLVNHFEILGYEKAAEIANLFIENGININTLDDAGDLPIALAAADLNPNAVKLLLSLGANPNLRDSFDSTALMQILNVNIFTEERKQQQLKIAKMLLKGGANPNALYKSDFLLRLATRQNLGEIVFSLLLHGADPNKEYCLHNFFEYAKKHPVALEAYAEFKKFAQRHQMILGATGMPKDLVNIINEYAVNLEYPQLREIIYDTIDKLPDDLVDIIGEYAVNLE